MRSKVRELMNKDVLNEFNGISFSEKGVRTEAWDRLLDSDLGSAGEDCPWNPLVHQ